MAGLVYVAVDHPSAGSILGALWKVLLWGSMTVSSWAAVRRNEVLRREHAGSGGS
ncbi:MULTISPECIES: hypothetical protein [unclassified Streptomyces]|uniref:hypothetical protein n=1 Tax=unclassified Streptomyces TaxID=2593676 RepID=UPI001371D2BF|nr:MULTISPECIES: hypothetical protein [unclassified Streptomyces]MYS22366.1 hypothetical protein [Streptomyces sp. SID4948]